MPSPIGCPPCSRSRTTSPRSRPAPFRWRRSRGFPSRSRRTARSPKAAIRDLARALAESSRPFLLAGRGAWLAGAGEALGELAALTGALTAGTALGRGIFPESEFDLGVTGGFGAAGAMDLIREADVAVVFGASLNQFTMRFGELFAPGTRVFQIDTAPTATHPHVGGYIRGDAAVVARLLVDELAVLPARSTAPWRESVDLTGVRSYDRGEGVAPDGRLDPRSVAVRIGELLPADRVVVSDGGHFIGWANMHWPVASPDRMIMVGTAFQSIGLGLASVPGAALGKPDATIVLTTGDGGGLMALADLESAVRVARGRGLAVVWNDAAYSAEVNLYGLKGLAIEPMLIPEVDFAGFARAVGARGGRGAFARGSRSPRVVGGGGCGIPPLPAARLPHLGRGDRAVPAGGHPRELLTGPADRFAHAVETATRARPQRPRLPVSTARTRDRRRMPRLTLPRNSGLRFAWNAAKPSR